MPYHEPMHPHLEPERADLGARGDDSYQHDVVRVDAVQKHGVETVDDLVVAPVDERRPGDLIRSRHSVEHLERGGDEVVPHEAGDHRVVGDGRPDGRRVKELEGEVRQAGRKVETRKAGGGGRGRA